MTRPLKVGVQLPEVEREVRWPELRDMARAAEQAGFDSLWVGDHLLFRDPDPPPRGGAPPIMVGTMGPRMLRLAAQHADAWNAWFTWFGNRPEGIAALREKVDAACAEVGRDPATLARTVAVLVQLEGAEVARRGGPQEKGPRLRGSPEELADQLRTFAAEGISHVQLVVDPITVRSIERLAPVLRALSR